MACDQVLDEVVSSYLRLVDAEAPDLVEGLYLVGSAALGDFDPAISDIDYVAVTASRPDASAIAALARVHRRLRRVRRRPTFDGVYVTWTDLSADPLRVQPVPGSHEGRFAADVGGRDPIAWHTLARYGVASRGPAPTALNVWTDTDALAAWTDDNLDRYWKRLLERSSRQYTPFGVYALTDYATVWSVTGLARLHYTLATGDITSKTGAAQHALDTFASRWHPILWESLRIRAGDTGRSMYHTRIDRRRDVLAFGQMAIEEGTDCTPAGGRAGRSGCEDCCMQRSGTDGSDWAADALRTRGLRATLGRCCVLEALADGRHLDVTTIIESVSRRVLLPAGSVPRVLADLREVGLVSDVPLPERPVWALTVIRRPHAHTRCRGCGEVSDVPASAVTLAEERLRSDHNFTVDPTATVFVGLCGRCTA